MKTPACTYLCTGLSNKLFSALILFLIILTACGEDKKDPSPYANANKKLMFDKDRVTIHRILLQSFRGSRERKDFSTLAKINSYFAGEALSVPVELLISG